MRMKRVMGDGRMVILPEIWMALVRDGVSGRMLVGVGIVGSIAGVGAMNLIEFRREPCASLPDFQASLPRLRHALILLQKGQHRHVPLP